MQNGCTASICIAGEPICTEFKRDSKDFGSVGIYPHPAYTQPLPGGIDFRALPWIGIRAMATKRLFAAIAAILMVPMPVPATGEFELEDLKTG